MSIDLGPLNGNQRTAVLWGDGPLLVLAGPGSGKTRVLTVRVARLLGESDDASVLALTFTTKAAAEMRQRVDDRLGSRASRAHLCTFHSFATDLLRQHGSHLALRPDFSLLTHDEDRIAVLEGVAEGLRDEDSSLPTDHRGLLELVDRLFAESYDGGPVAPFLVHTPEWVPSLFSAYCRALVTSGRLDFGSLLHLAHQLLHEKPDVARVVRLAWTHVCVDEFQDTNKAQYDLLRLLVPERRPNLFVVADDDQIIYQWNGASPERLLALRRDYGMEVIQLPENYRCPPQIIDLANKLIVHNRLRDRDKTPLTACRTVSLSDDVIRYGVLSDPEEEMSVVAGDMRDRGVAPSECVVLARTTKLLQQAATAIRAAGLDAYVAQRKADFTVPVVQVVLSALRLCNARHDRDVLRRLVVAWNALANCQIEAEGIAASAALVGGDYLRAWTDAGLPRGDGDPATLISRIRSALVDRLEFASIVEWFLGDGWEPWRDEWPEDLAEEIATWREVHGDIVREFGHDDLTLNLYLQHLDLAPKTARPGQRAIRCMTVHAAKGLEFRHVYLVGMAQDVLPSFHALRKGAQSKELEEERRNCFVAITRVQETLTITRARRYGGWPKDASQFIAEMGIGEPT